MAASMALQVSLSNKANLSAISKVSAFPVFLNNRLPVSMILPSGQQGSTNSPVCRSVWARDGSICNPSQVVNFANTKLAESTYSAARLQPWTTKISQAMTSSVAKLSVQAAVKPPTLARAAPRFLLPGMSSGSSGSIVTVVPNFNFNAASLHLVYNAAIFQPLVQFNFATFTNEMDKCWKYLSHARKVSMCYACSQTNSKYFQGNKAIILQEDCKNMLTSCLPFFKQVTLYIKSAHHALVEYQQQQQSNWNQERHRILKNLNTAMTAADLTNLISQYYSSSTGAAAKLTVGNKLCLKLFRLYTSPIFDLVGRLVESVKQELAEVNPGRLLNDFFNALAPGDDSDPFSGDVAILFTGANGPMLQSSDSSISPVGNSGKEAMNLTNAFA